MSTVNDIIVPPGFTLHTENTSHILLPTDEVFLNPVQEFNRDLSVACIAVWSEELNASKTTKRLEKQKKKLEKHSRNDVHSSSVKNLHQIGSQLNHDLPLTKRSPSEPYRFVLLEALSATGLRSIRYAKEIPLLKYVIANDLSSAAVQTIKRNINVNGLSTTMPEAKVRINEGDACTLMYSHREQSQRVDVVDLDPYGTAAPFIDAAMQCLKDDGLLCVTCTDLSVLATTNYPEKCFSNYGGVPAKAEYCHEVALRLVLHSLSTSASRYGRYIEPFLSLSIDFYVRLFVRVRSSASEVKKALVKTSSFFICSACQSFYEQPLGRVVEKERNMNHLFKIQAGPPVANSCSECQSPLHIAGPMWSGPLQDAEFIGKVLKHLSTNMDKFGTAIRMKGMLTVAREELQVPFYFTPSKVASLFHCKTPPLEDIASALLHARHSVSRSHACPGSLKTSASRRDIHSVFRSWICSNPVKMENISEGSPARRLLSKEPDFEANFSRHTGCGTFSGNKLVRYQENPSSHWGPGTKAQLKRKRDCDDS